MTGMKNILRKHPDVIIAVLAAVFAGAVIYAYAWGIGSVAEAVYRAVSAPVGGGSNVGFDLQGARALDLRGLVSEGQ